MSKKLTEKLYRAIEYRDIQLLTSVLKNKNCPVNNLSKENEVTRKTPLHMACYLAFEDAVRLLISQKDIDVNCTDCNNWTPLHFAINSRNLNIVLQLLKHKDININIVTKDKTSILHYLCRTIFPDEWDSIYKSIINLICERGIDINANDKNKETPLHQAVAKSNKTSVEILLKLKAELNLRNSLGETPLLYAAKNEDTSMIDILLDNGADINITPNVEENILSLCSPEVAAYIEKKLTPHNPLESSVWNERRLSIPNRSESPVINRFHSRTISSTRGVVQENQFVNNAQFMPQRFNPEPLLQMKSNLDPRLLLEYKSYLEKQKIQVQSLLNFVISSHVPVSPNQTVQDILQAISSMPHY